MQNIDFQTKRKAIEKNRGGGSSGFTDAQINILWGSLDDITKQQYLDSLPTEKLKIKESKHADRNKTE